MAFHLGREEGLFAGVSTRSNVAAALKGAEQLEPEATVVGVLGDKGMTYLKAYGMG